MEQACFHWFSFRNSNRTVSYLEHGLTAKMYLCVNQAAREACRISKIALFQNEEDYVSEYSGGFSDLGYENFARIFLYHSLLCSLLFAAFAGHHSFKLIKFVLSQSASLK